MSVDLTREQAEQLRDYAAAHGHTVMVTEGVFGRAHTDCTCGFTRVAPSKPAANRVGLAHAREAVAAL